MSDFGKKSPFATSSPKPVRSPANFVEALKSIGGQTVRSIANDVVKPVSGDFINSITNGPSRSQNGEQSRVPEWYRQKETDQFAEMLRRERHKEVLSQNVFDRRQEEVKAKIKALQDELKALAKDIAAMSIQIEKAVHEEIVHPGAYHISFFEKLKQLIVHLRKEVAESKNWLSISSSRKNAQNVYWGNVKKSGTKFMLSQERYMATQAG